MARSRVFFIKREKRDYENGGNGPTYDSPEASDLINLDTFL
jgi:hypothetical protein